MKNTDEQPFILDLHDIEYPKIRELREKEFDLVAGGWPPSCPPGQDWIWTMEVTQNSDGGNWIKDECTPAGRVGSNFGNGGA